MLFRSEKSSCEHRSGSYVLGPVWKGVSVLVMAAFLAVSCGGDEPVEPTPPSPPTPEKDTKAPVITVSTSTVNVIAVPEMTVSGSELKVGAMSVATWKDDVSASCAVEVNLTPTTGIAKAVKT